MANDTSPMFMEDFLKEMRDATKAVPGLVGLVALWFLILQYTFGNWQYLEALSSVDKGSLASILAFPLALITYYLGNFWDDHVFDPRYTDDPQRGFKGKWLETSRRNYLGLFPVGRNLKRTREDARQTLGLSSVEGIYGIAKERLQDTPKWTKVGRLLRFSKLCRSLIWPCFLIAGGLLTYTAYIAIIERRLHSSPLITAVISLLIGSFLFIPYINLRVEHMVLLYRRVKEITKTDMKEPMNRSEI